jgi:anti-sigma factor NepR-like protein
MTNTALLQLGQRADRRRQWALGRVLSREYAAVTAEPVPEDFMLLLSNLDQKRAANLAADRQPL